MKKQGIVYKCYCSLSLPQSPFGDSSLVRGSQCLCNLPNTILQSDFVTNQTVSAVFFYALLRLTNTHRGYIIWMQR